MKNKINVQANNSRMTSVSMPKEDFDKLVKISYSELQISKSAFVQFSIRYFSDKKNIDSLKQFIKNNRS